MHRSDVTTGDCGTPPDAVIALDFGGTKLAAAVAKISAHGPGRCWLVHGRCPSPAGHGANAVYERMLRLVGELLSRSDARPRAVGVSFDGPVDLAKGRPLACHHVTGWPDFPLGERLAQEYGVPVVVENDATAAALGEWHHGAGRGSRNMLYITVSTGIGGGLVLGGTPYRGAQGLAGEIGHMCLDPLGPICACGRRGCLEALASGPAIVRHVHALLRGQPNVSSSLRDRDKLTSRDVGIAANAGDELAGHAMRRAARALGSAIGNTLNLLNLERVILDGGVTRAGATYLAWVREAARETALDGVAVEIVLADLGGDAPLWGACVLAKALVKG